MPQSVLPVCPQDDADDDSGATIPPWQAARASGGRGERRQPIFTVGEVIAGRYKIERFIAFGGMGEVYAAEDRELQEKVALKTVREDISQGQDQRVVERFKREIALARKVTHRNVCRIFDFGSHVAPSGDRPPQTFLTMELLDGESLAERIATKGPISAADALPLVKQMVDALEAAHQVGIVHRDFKSGNVLLVPDGARVRAVVTDFGLARASDADPFSTNSDADAGQGMVGSPVYMAPEQVEGGLVDKRADVYALGVVMFEMLTANIPFTGDNAMAIAVKRIKEPAPSPRMFVPMLDARWEAAVLRCLERLPEARFDSAAAVLAYLSSAKPEVTNKGIVIAALKRKPRSRWWIGIAAASALALGGVGLYVRANHKQPVRATIPAPDQVTQRRSVAVIGFSNLTKKPESDWISTALGEMFTTDLATGGKLRMVPGESVGRMKQELQLSSAASYAPDTLDKIKRNLNADLVIVGSYMALGTQLRLDVRMQDAATGETIAQMGEMTTEAELASVVTRVSAQLRDKLQVAQAQRGEGIAFVNTALPQNPEAAKLYSEGLARMRLYKMADARDSLERAMQIEPGFPMAHEAMFEVLNYLGAEDRAHSEISKAFDLREKLPTEQRLRVESMYYFELEDKKRRFEAAQELYQMAPDNIDYGMSYVNALFAVDEKAGIAALDKLAATPQAQKEPRFYLMLMNVAYAKHQFETVIAEAKKLAKAGEERGTLSFIGEAKSQMAVSEWFLGDLRSALADSDEARRIAFTIGDRDGVAAALTAKAFIQSDFGDYAGAQKSSEDALNFAAEVGSRRRVWLAQHTLARAFTFRGDLREGLKHFEESRITSVDQRSDYGEAIAYLGIAATEILQGDLLLAQPTFDKILFKTRLFMPKNAIAYVQHFRGEMFRWMGEWKEARAAYEEGRRIRDEFHDKFQSTRDQIGIAEVARHEGKLDEAFALATTAVKTMNDIGDYDDEAFAECVLARVALARGKPIDAVAPLRRAQIIADGTQSAAVKLDIAHARAELLAATGKSAEARTLIDESIAAAQAKGLLGYAMWMRLTRTKWLSPADVAPELAKLHAEAKQRGFKWIAEATAIR